MNSALTSLTTLYAGIPLWAWIAAGLAVLVLIILIISVSVASRRRSKWIARLICGWLTPAGSPIRFWRLPTAPRAPRTRPHLDRRRATHVDAQPATLRIVDHRADRQALPRQPRQLAYAVDGLRQALDADVRLRTQGYAPGQDTVIAESAMVVGQRRRDLDVVLAGCATKTNIR